MPKSTSATQPTLSSTAAKFIAFQLRDSQKKILVPRPKDYKDAVALVRGNFRRLKQQEIQFSTNALKEEFGSGWVVITPSVWDDISRHLSVVFVSTREPSPPLDLTDEETVAPVVVRPKREQRIDVQHLPRVQGKDEGMVKVSFVVTFGDKRSRTLMVKRSTLIKKIRSVVAEGLSCCPSSLHLIHDGDRAKDEDPVSTLEEDGEVEFYLYQEQVGGKPVIYLFPPMGRALHVSVSLSLVPEWSFSAVYPIAPVKPIGNRQGELITWDVEVKPGGDMIDKSSQLEVSYLFWEAHTNVGKPLSPPASRPASPVDAAAAANGLEDFTPLTASLLPSNSVLITFDEVTTYIDRSLKMLDLHVEARTSFITYWLPALSAHKFIALRFVSQASYERAARLDVKPRPDVVERIFMIFHGLNEEAASTPEWNSAIVRAKEDVSLWRDVVGLQGEPGALMKDESLFRVLEWGGMEVH